MGSKKGLVNSMMTSILNALFGCAHRKTSFPITPARRAGFAQGVEATRTKTYVTCLDCGKEFDYDWNEMRIGAEKSGLGTVIAPPTFTVHQSVR